MPKSELPDVKYRINTAAYLASMSLGALVSLGRGFLIAALLTVPDFGRYALVVSTGAFASSIVSFGLIEATWKTYPRLWHSQARSLVLDDALDRALKLAVRSLIASAIGAALFAMTGHNALLGAAAGLVSGSFATASLYASVNRATTSKRMVAVANLVRAFSSLALAFLGLHFFGLPGAIAGEIAGSLASSAYVHQQCKAHIRSAKVLDALADNPAADAGPRHGGILVFLGFLAAAVPTLLDRSFVSWNFGTEPLGRYAFLILFVTGANTFAGIIAQHVGPRLLTMEQGGSTIGAQLRFIVRWALLFWAVWGLGIGAVAVASGLGLLDAYAGKYGLTAASLLPVLLLGALQLSVLFDFLLMSKDRETSILAAGLSYLAAALVGAMLVSFGGLGVTAMMLLLAAAKLVHLAVQVALVFKARRALGREAGLA